MRAYMMPLPMLTLAVLALSGPLWPDAAAAACPEPRQPMLSQQLSQMISERRGGDALECLRQIERDAEGQPLDDEVRYQLALQATDALASVYRDAVPLRVDTALGVRLLERYLTQVGAPFDQSRISFATRKLVQLGRYVDFFRHLNVVADGVVKAPARWSADDADFLFSTLKRCPEWSRRHEVLRCTPECRRMSQEFTSRLDAAWGPRPWSGADGRARLSLNADRLLQESQACDTPPSSPR